MSSAQPGSSAGKSSNGCGCGCLALIIISVLVGLWFHNADVQDQQQKQQATATLENTFPDLAKFPALEAVVGGNTNDTPPIPRLKNLVFSPTTNHVTVEVNMDQNLTDKLTTDTVKMLVSDIFIAVFHENDYKPQSVDVNVYGPLQDKFGHITQDVVYSASLDSGVANQVNWSDDKADLELSVLPGLWTTTYNFHDQF